MEGTDYETFGFMIPSQVIITIGSDGQLLIVNSSAAPGQIANCGTNLIARQRDSRSYVHPMVVSARRHMYLLERAWLFSHGLGQNRAFDSHGEKDSL
jgi:hypothetical protein